VCRNSILSLLLQARNNFEAIKKAHNIFSIYFNTHLHIEHCTLTPKKYNTQQTAATYLAPLHFTPTSRYPSGPSQSSRFLCAWGWGPRHGWAALIYLLRNNRLLRIRRGLLRRILSRNREVFIGTCKSNFCLGISWVWSDDVIGYFDFVKAVITAINCGTIV